jgi:hypothetical protein
LVDHLFIIILSFLLSLDDSLAFGGSYDQPYFGSGRPNLGNPQGTMARSPTRGDYQSAFFSRVSTRKDGDAMILRATLLLFIASIYKSLHAYCCNNEPVD